MDMTKVDLNSLYTQFMGENNCDGRISPQNYILCWRIANKSYLTKGDKLMISMLLDPVVEARFDKEWAALMDWNDEMNMKPKTYTEFVLRRDETRARARESVLGHFRLKF